MDKRYFVGMPSPAAAGIPAATVFAYPYGLEDWRALLAIPMTSFVKAVLIDADPGARWVNAWIASSPARAMRAPTLRLPHRRRRLASAADATPPVDAPAQTQV